MDVGEAFDLISRAIDAQRVPGGYLVVGDLKGNARELVARILAKLYPGDKDKIAANVHPDIAILEPEGKSRTIKTQEMRERLIEAMASTSYSGGWKTGVVTGADRMQQAAANAFLKSLEEPTPKTLYLLLTDRPDAMLPTIISRCQRVDLPMPTGLLDEDSAKSVDEVFGAASMAGVYERSQAARFLADALGDLKESAKPEDVAIVRKAFFMTIMSHVRRWMVEGLVPRHLAFRNIEAVEEAYSRSERYIADDAVLSFMMDKLVFPNP